MEEITKQNCEQCGTPSETKCARCKVSYYCGRECQKKHWKSHKKYCKQFLYETEQDEELQDDEDQVLSTDDMILKAKVGKSSVHGNGVFATKHITQGELICFFHGQSKDANTKVRIRRMPDGTLSIIDSQIVFSDAINKGKRSLSVHTP